VSIARCVRNDPTDSLYDADCGSSARLGVARSCEATASVDRIGRRAS
jgi:hypothetical protein